MHVPTWVKTGAAVTAAALLGSRAARPDSRWYRNLDKPAWQPPAQAFPVVWTLLYSLLAYAGARTIDAMPPGKRRACLVWRPVAVGRTQRKHLPPRLPGGGQPVDERKSLAAEPPRWQ